MSESPMLNRDRRGKKVPPEQAGKHTPERRYVIISVTGEDISSQIQRFCERTGAAWSLGDDRADLLAALQASKERLGAYLLSAESDEEHDTLDRVLLVVEAAIAKATGGKA